MPFSRFLVWRNVPERDKFCKLDLTLESDPHQIFHQTIQTIIFGICLIRIRHIPNIIVNNDDISTTDSRILDNNAF